MMTKKKAAALTAALVALLVVACLLRDSADDEYPPVLPNETQRVPVRAPPVEPDRPDLLEEPAPQ